MIASLPMYDWPHLRPATNALWQVLATALRHAGFDAPLTLDRPVALDDHWTKPDLLLSQTCAMPFRQGLWRHVSVLGAVDFDLPGCAPGYYNSVIICRAGAAQAVADFDRPVCALNARHSQSGFAALMHSLTQQGIAPDRIVETGAHQQSIIAVQAGRADIAAIDAVSWRIAQQSMPGLDQVQVLTHTPPTPGLPLICHRELPVERIRDAVSVGFEQMTAAIAAALHIKSFVPSTNDAYRTAPY